MIQDMLALAPREDRQLKHWHRRQAPVMDTQMRWGRHQGLVLGRLSSFQDKILVQVVGRLTLLLLQEMM
jgi:hypothetical protein